MPAFQIEMTKPNVHILCSPDASDTTLRQVLYGLEEEGIRTNVTLVFSRSQALAVARLGAKFVSPFVGWKENFGEDTASYLQDIVETYRNYSYDTEIIVAAVRSGKVLADAARMGADIVTCSLEVMKNSVYHPFTDYGLRFFTEAWNAVEAME